MWAREDDIEAQALQQLRNISELPWVAGLRVMPDVHYGKGATVGSVIAMRDAVSPNAVGVDIGCGMNAVRTSLTASDLPDDLAPLRSKIEAAVPVGFHSHDEPVDLRSLRPVDGSAGKARLRGNDEFWGRFDGLHDGVQDRQARARKQMGTLGGGNHFIEVCLDESDRVWLQLHSGSRNIGKELAERHVAIAKALTHNQGLADADLAVFIGGTAQMTAYLSDLRWAQEYAARSRAVMMALVTGVVRDHFDSRQHGGATGTGVTFTEGVNVHHNYVAVEQLDGEELIVTRKGAIRAGSGEMGLIPGSMGTGSYVVRGLGNPASFYSASHGAGRRMSRGAAKRTFSTADLAEQTAGVECRKDAGVLDEIPGAYKNLDDVIAAQHDLVEVVARLRTIVCVKG
nr:RtcB family protein [Pseudactinotalea sp. HY160]